MRADRACRMQISEEKSGGQSELEQRILYFCMSACKDRFGTNPTQFTFEDQ